MNLPGRYVDFGALFPPSCQQEIPQIRCVVNYEVLALSFAKGSIVHHLFKWTSFIQAKAKPKTFRVV